MIKNVRKSGGCAGFARKSRGGPSKKKSLMEKNPQLKGTVLKTMIMKPKKPNSANRKICKIKLELREGPFGPFPQLK